MNHRQACEEADVFSVIVEKKSLPKRLGMAAQESVDGLLLRWLERGVFSRFYSDLDTHGEANAY